MHQRVGDMFGHKVTELQYKSSDLFVLPRCKIGVEIELEEMRGYIVKSPLITTKEEGSLRRGGLEYIFSTPMFGCDALTALDNLEKELSGRSPVIDSNCSLHVHLDVRDMSPVHLGKFILLYIIYEQTLYKYAAPDRENNIFSLSFNRTREVIAPLANIISSINSGRLDNAVMYVDDMPRYCGLNLRALQRFGSVEFRAHDATYKKDEIVEWINVIMCLKRAAMNDKIDVRPYMTIKSMGAQQATKEVFGEYAKLLDDKTLVRDIDVGTRLARMIVNHTLLSEAFSNLDIPSVGSSTEEGAIHSDELTAWLNEPIEASDGSPPEFSLFNYRPSDTVRDTGTTVINALSPRPRPATMRRG